MKTKGDDSGGMEERAPRPESRSSARASLWRIFREVPTQLAQGVLWAAGWMAALLGSAHVAVDVFGLYDAGRGSFIGSTAGWAKLSWMMGLFFPYLILAVLTYRAAEKATGGDQTRTLPLTGFELLLVLSVAGGCLLAVL